MHDDERQRFVEAAPGHGQRRDHGDVIGVVPCVASS